MSITWVRSILAGQVLLNQLLAELALHERVGGDLPDEPGRPSGGSSDGQVEESLHERHRQRILPVAGLRIGPGRPALAAGSFGVMYGGLATTAW